MKKIVEKSQPRRQLKPWHQFCSNSGSSGTNALLPADTYRESQQLEQTTWMMLFTWRKTIHISSYHDQSNLQYYNHRLRHLGCRRYLAHQNWGLQFMLVQQMVGISSIYLQDRTLYNENCSNFKTGSLFQAKSWYLKCSLMAHNSEQSY